MTVRVCAIWRVYARARAQKVVGANHPDAHLFRGERGRKIGCAWARVRVLSCVRGRMRVVIHCPPAVMGLLSVASAPHEAQAPFLPRPASAQARPIPTCPPSKWPNARSTPSLSTHGFRRADTPTSTQAMPQNRRTLPSPLPHAARRSRRSFVLHSRPTVSTACNGATRPWWQSQKGGTRTMSKGPLPFL